jgi:hypothetical protein
MQEIEAVEERRARTPPIAGAFIAAAVLGIAVEKAIQTPQGLYVAD